MPWRPARGWAHAGQGLFPWRAPGTGTGLCFPCGPGQERLRSNATCAWTRERWLWRVCGSVWAKSARSCWGQNENEPWGSAGGQSACGHAHSRPCPWQHTHLLHREPARLTRTVTEKCYILYKRLVNISTQMKACETKKLFIHYFLSYFFQNLSFRRGFVKN